VAKYLIEASYTPEGVKGLLKEGGSGRRAAIEQLINSAGGSVEACYFVFGDDDVIRHDHTVASFESEAPDQDFRASASTVVHIWYTASRTLAGSQGQPRSSLK